MIRIYTKGFPFYYINREAFLLNRYTFTINFKIHSKTGRRCRRQVSMNSCKPPFSYLLLTEYNFLL